MNKTFLSALFAAAMTVLLAAAFAGCEKIDEKLLGDGDAIQETDAEEEAALEDETESAEDDAPPENDEITVEDEITDEFVEETADDSREEEAAEADAEGETDAEINATKCKLPPLLDTTFDIDPDGADGQIHPEAVVFDGAIWIAYNKPDKNNKFDVYYTALECDGSARIKPYLVNTSDFNDIDPTIAAAKDGVFIAWSSDNGAAPRNLDIYFRVFTKEGVPLSGQDSRYSAKGADDKDESNAWMVKAAALADGSFAIAGNYAPADAKQWQTFAQIIGGDGALKGELIRPYADPENGQLYPHLAQAEDGRLFIGWGEAGANDASNAVVVAFDPLNFTPPVDKRYTAIVNPAGEYVCLSADPQNGLVYLSGNSGGSLPKPVLTDVTTLGGPGSGYINATAGGGKAEYSAVVQAADDGAAIGWFRNISGFRNDFFAQRFKYTTGSFVKKSDPYKINENPALSYQPSLTYLGGGYFLALWVEGTSPKLRLKGKIFAM